MKYMIWGLFEGRVKTLRKQEKERKQQAQVSERMKIFQDNTLK